MRRAILAGMVAGMTIALFAPRAEACGRGGYPGGGAVMALGIGAIAVAATDIGLTLYDLPSIFTAQPRSPGYGAFEMFFGGAQVALGIAGMSSNTSGFWTGYTIWMGALTLHGIWSIAGSLRDAPHGGVPAPDPPRDDPHLPLQITIGPTYVPVGQFAHPGVGLVGRF